MIPGVINSHLCTKNPTDSHICTHGSNKRPNTAEGPLQQTEKAGIRIAGVFHMHTCNLTN